MRFVLAVTVEDMMSELDSFMRDVQLGSLLRPFGKNGELRVKSLSAKMDVEFCGSSERMAREIARVFGEQLFNELKQTDHLAMVSLDLKRVIHGKKKGVYTKAVLRRSFPPETEIQKGGAK